MAVRGGLRKYMQTPVANHTFVIYNNPTCQTVITMKIVIKSSNLWHVLTDNAPWCWQSKKTTQVRMDLRILMSPLFYGISEKSPVCMAQLESKVSKAALRNAPVLVQNRPN